MNYKKFLLCCLKKNKFVACITKTLYIVQGCVYKDNRLLFIVHFNYNRKHFVN